MKKTQVVRYSVDMGRDRVDFVFTCLCAKGESGGGGRASKLL